MDLESKYPSISSGKIHVYPVWLHVRHFSIFSLCFGVINFSKKQLRDKIVCYFAQQGEIESIDYYSDSGHALVQLKDYASMEAVLAKKEHQIGNVIITVKAALVSHWYPLNILFLNDDCIYWIFQKLSLDELSTVADVCTRFKTIAKRVFSNKFSHFDTSKQLSKVTKKSSFSENNDEVFITMMRPVFRNFGSSIKSLYLSRLSNGNYNKQIFKLMALYCSGVDSMLTKLTMDNFEVDELSESTLQYVKLIFKRLSYLGVKSGSQCKELGELLSDCSELTHLILIDVSFNDFLKHKFQKLKSIRLRGSGLQDNTIELLAKSNSHLKALIIDNTRLGITTEIFSIVGSMFQCLEELAILHAIVMNTNIRCPKDSVSHLGALKLLKSLTLYCYELPVEPLLQALIESSVPIDHLILSNFELSSNMADSLSKMNQLLELQLDEVYVYSEHLVKIVKNVPHMKSLYLFKSGQVSVSDIKQLVKASNKLSNLTIINKRKYTIVEDDFKTLAQSVEHRFNGTTLEVTIGLKTIELEVPRDVIDENRKWLHIRNMCIGSTFVADDSTDESESDDSMDIDDGSDEDSEDCSRIENICQIFEQQLELESTYILRTAHQMSISSQCIED